MKFKVSRASVWDKSVKPCDKAKLEECVNLDVRTLKTPEEYDLKFKNGETWLSRGKNHCINEDGFIQREFTDKAWFVDINTLEELLEFLNENERIILNKKRWWSNKFEIMIYDDYVE